MVTLIDNLNLSKKERAWYERLFQLHPLPPRTIRWIDLEKLAEGVEAEISEDDIPVLVATGGAEIYQGNHREVFVFQSPNFGKSGQAVAKFYQDEYEKITNDPITHHRKELDRLEKFLDQHKGERIKIVEGDIGNSGLSMARLCAIYKIVNEKNTAEILIGAAPQRNIFAVKRQTSLVLPGGQNLYNEDLRNILDLNGIPLKVIETCQDGYIRRASELMGVERKEELEGDVRTLTKYWKSCGLSNQEIREHAHRYRILTLKKIDRIGKVSDKIRQLSNT